MLREFLILSRGGQGGVTASRILASAAVLEGLWAQAIPEFGAERRGAIVKSYLRVSNGPIARHSSVKKPEGVAVFSSRILELVDISKLAPEGAPVIVNASEKPKIPGREVYYVNATSIAVELGLVIAGWPLVNTAMSSAMAKVFRIASLESVVNALSEYFKGELLKANVEAARLAWNSVSG